ncbi:MAG: hypothetical protein NT005_14015 [Spirochaetes bacterium]|jgi:hypothetical protein|nr:hypothetical protein [Spirochaetota bacterium]
MAAHILEAMEELKTCLFCGKNVDGTFQFCPHCGYEFGQGEDIPALIDETRGSVAQAARKTGEDYLGRLRSLEELLSSMEKELDLMLKTSSRDP